MRLSALILALLVAVLAFSARVEGHSQDRGRHQHRYRHQNPFTGIGADVGKTWPEARKLFPKLLKSSARVDHGNYRLYNPATRTYATFFSRGNNLRMFELNEGHSDLPDAQVFTVKRHQTHHWRFNGYSIHHNNQGGNEKCLTAGYGRHADIFALMDMCRIDYTQKPPRGEGDIGTPKGLIRFDKQIFLFVPGPGETFRIVAVAHAWDRKPRCVYPLHVQGYGNMAPHFYAGLALDQCWGTTGLSKNPMFLWKLEKV